MSIYLILQKDRVKIENLLLLGYAPKRIARPYELFVLAVHTGTVVLAWLSIWGIRGCYLPFLQAMQAVKSGMLPVWVGGIVLFSGVFLLNAGIIRRKVRKTALSHKI